MVNIAEQLTAMAARYPDKRAVVWTAGRDASGRARYAHVTFTELDQETDRYAHGFENVGITRGTRTIFFVPPGLDFFALVFALFKVGAATAISKLTYCKREPLTPGQSIHRSRSARICPNTQ